MKSKLIRTSLILLFLLTAWPFNFRVQAQQQGQVTGLAARSGWVNQAGSIFTIDGIDPNGLLTGTYINRNPDYGCQYSSYAVTGWVYGRAITFAVNWSNSVESCNSITSWTGFYYNNRITTLWQLVINGSTSTNQIIQGTDTFTQSAVVVNESLARKK